MIQETIFSGLPGYLELYRIHCQGQPVSKSADSMRFEGFLFGFPPCCVDAFIQAPYTKNALSSEDQKLLFHWACPDCRITPLMLPLYRRFYTYMLDA